MIASRTRGPLRALHNPGDLNIPSLTEDLHFSDNSDCDRMDNTSLNFETEELSQTPLVRNPARTRPRRSCSFYGISAPLRASSYRAGKSSTALSVEDIRHHFPIRCTPKKNNDEQTADKVDKIEETSQLAGLKRCGDASEEIVLPKQARYSNSSDYRPVQLTMGAYVKAHPRYHRRRSEAEAPQLSSTVDTVSIQSVPTACSRLSPICLVPMPEGFPSQLPGCCATVSLPWEAVTWESRYTPQKTTETQTSPPVGIDETNSPFENKRTRRRLNLGSSHVIVGLKRTLGNLRRAVSADRLNKSGQTPPPNCISQSPLTNKDISGQKKQTRPKERWSLTKRLNNRSVKNRRISTGSVQNLDPVGHPSRYSPGVDVGFDTIKEHPKDEEEEKLTCRVINKYPDGSWRVTFRRSSTSQQFGFFIARDAQGIYISRMGSVRCAVKFWNIFHVGDRVLEVQGISCTKLTAEDVQNLIRGLELVEFRIKPAHVPTGHS